MSPLSPEEERAELWECPGCAFGFDARHTNHDGEHSCPNCGEQAALARVADLERDYRLVLIQRDAARQRVEALEGALRELLRHLRPFPTMNGTFSDYNIQLNPGRGLDAAYVCARAALNSTEGSGGDNG